jgi:peroxiredoxin
MRGLIKFSFLLLAVAGVFMAATSSVDFGLKVGDKAPDFKLKNIDGKYYSLEDVKDANGEKPKGYIVTFTCNTCPYAVMYEDRLVELHNAMAPKGYPVVAIMPNDTDIKPGDDLAAMSKRAEDKGFDFLYLIDEKQEVFPAYGASRTPEIYLLDSDMVVRYTGAIDDNAHVASAVKTNYVMDAVASLEAGKSPDPAKTKAIGCSIKVKR